MIEKDLLNILSWTLTIMERIAKMQYIKIKNFYSLKDTIKRENANCRVGKAICKTYPR